MTQMFLATTIGILTVVFSGCLESAHAHAGMRNPKPRFGGAMGCGNRGDGVGKPQSTIPGTNCGLCGEDIDQPSSTGDWRPRDIEYGGKYGKRGPMAVFTEGDRIFTSAAIWNPHGGFMEWRLCPNAEWEITMNQTCFHYLLNVRLIRYDPVESSTEPKPYISWNASIPTQIDVNTGIRPTCNGKGCDLWLTAELELPSGVSCSRCVIQYNYRGRASETFRSCSDIRILPADMTPPFDLLKNEETGQCLSQVTENSQQLMLATCNSSDPLQKVIGFQPWSDYTVKANNSIALNIPGNCIEIKYEYTFNWADVSLYNCEVDSNDDKSNQNWAFTNKSENETFQIVSELINRCLTVSKKSGKFYMVDCIGRHEVGFPSSNYQYWTVLTTPDLLPDQIPVEFFQNL